MVKKKYLQNSPTKEPMPIKTNHKQIRFKASSMASGHLSIGVKVNQGGLPSQVS